MKSGVKILRELAFKEPGTIAMGFIIYPVHNDPKNINNLRHYDIVSCSWEEALEKVENCKRMINKNFRPVMVKVIMEVIEPKEGVITGKLKKELYPSDLRMTREEKRVLEDFFVEAQRLIVEREARGDETRPFAPTGYLKQMYKIIIGYGAGKCQAVKRMEKTFTF